VSEIENLHIVQLYRSQNHVWLDSPAFHEKFKKKLLMNSTADPTPAKPMKIEK